MLNYHNIVLYAYFYHNCEWNVLVKYDVTEMGQLMGNDENGKMGQGGPEGVVKIHFLYRKKITV